MRSRVKGICFSTHNTSDIHLGFSTLSNSSLLCRHPLGVLQLIHFWQLGVSTDPQVKDAVPQDSPYFRCQLQAGSPQMTHISFWFGYRSGFPPHYSISFYNGSFWETFYLQLPVYYKGYYKGYRWESDEVLGTRYVEGACMPSPRNHSASTSTFTNLETLWTSSFWVLTEASLIT